LKNPSFPGFQRGNFALFLTDIFALKSGPIGQKLGQIGSFKTLEMTDFAYGRLKPER